MTLPFQIVYLYSGCSIFQVGVQSVLNYTLYILEQVDKVAFRIEKIINLRILPHFRQLLGQFAHQVRREFLTQNVGAVQFHLSAAHPEYLIFVCRILIHHPFSSQIALESRAFFNGASQLMGFIMRIA